MDFNDFENRTKSSLRNALGFSFDFAVFCTFDKCFVRICKRPFFLMLSCNKIVFFELLKNSKTSIETNVILMILLL
jgi:hypothetical protein